MPGLGENRIKNVPVIVLCYALKQSNNHSARQEPGKYLAKPAVFAAAVGPQIHVATWSPTVGAVQLANVEALTFEHGAMRTSTWWPSAAAFAVTVTMPVVAVVSTLSTYLLVCTDDSQPQAFATGRVPAEDWKTSVIVVRQAEAASTTSEAFALTV